MMTMIDYLFSMRRLEQGQRQGQGGQRVLLITCRTTDYSTAAVFTAKYCASVHVLDFALVPGNCTHFMCGSGGGGSIYIGLILFFVEQLCEGYYWYGMMI